MELNLSITTFNVLCPEYKRLGKGMREGYNYSLWKHRHQRIIAFLQETKSSVICLQEFWFDDDDFVELYKSAFCKTYNFIGLQRPGYKSDGLFVMVSKGLLQIVNSENVVFALAGQRVALLCHLRIKGVPDSDFILATTHLTFPHGYYDERMQVHQSRIILNTLQSYADKSGLNKLPTFLCGDMNGEIDDEPCQNYIKKGFQCSFSTVHGRPSCVTHETHRGEETNADYIFFMTLEQTKFCKEQNNTFACKAKKLFSRKKSDCDMSEQKDISPSQRNVIDCCEVVNSSLLPEDLPDQEWPAQSAYTLSDHRPLKSVFTLKLLTSSNESS